MKHLRSMTAIYFLALFWASCLSGCSDMAPVEPKNSTRIQTGNYAGSVYISTTDYEGRKYVMFQSSGGGLAVFDRGPSDAEASSVK